MRVAFKIAGFRVQLGEPSGYPWAGWWSFPATANPKWRWVAWFGPFISIRRARVPGSTP